MAGKYPFAKKARIKALSKPKTFTRPDEKDQDDTAIRFKKRMKQQKEFNSRTYARKKLKR